MNWTGGIHSGNISKRKDSKRYTVSFRDSERGNIFKSFYFSTYGSKENALKNAQDFKRKISMERYLSRNVYREIDEGIEFKLEQGNTSQIGYINHQDLHFLQPVKGKGPWIIRATGGWWRKIPICGQTCWKKMGTFTSPYTPWISNNRSYQWKWSR